MEQNKRYQVFISSTFSDLKAERLAVLNQLLSINCIPVGMELFPAADEEQFEYIKRLIDESDYYVVIIAGRYGSLADDGFSYTEKEYDYAVLRKIPVLAFLHEHPGQIPSGYTDPENSGKLAAFRKKASTKRLVKYWTNADNLSSQVLAALLYAFNANPRTGWVRADSVQTDSVLALSQIEEQLNQAKRSNEEKEKAIDSLQRKCKGLSAKLEESRKQESTLIIQLEELKKQDSELIIQLKELKKQDSAYIIQLEELKKQDFALISQLEELKKQESALRLKLEESSKQVELLTQQLKIAQVAQKQSQLQPLKQPDKNEPYFIGSWNDKPMEWLVLDVQSDRALLIAKDCLLIAPYNEEDENITWAECSLRRKVLPKLLKQIFDDKECNRILLCQNNNRDNERYGTLGGVDTDDRLFMLSIDEAKQHFSSDKARMARLNGSTVWWWLRSLGFGSSCAAFVNPDGSVIDNGNDVSWSGAAVRPAFWLNLKS